ncbi:sulfotransferase domain-containing protein [Mucilaginibacter sp. HMF5004]|uniref:sulfotransferase domain-containing protein n=1 Tax=Mucilaginibacter rivuli TaxID=2857527 RepID=UPI001C5EBCBC|nr:sulfotransferase domain-containing protein [Mucilaginibacter rivuli]MBW4890009.1 sulfotransferase domain-containing protein [Mucilaginibacter rivuli]
MESDKKIVWLASYPKSGNTWFRAFITALLNNGEVDINNLATDGIFSSRRLFNEQTDLESNLLYDEEAKQMQGNVFNHICAKAKQRHLFVKIHDAYTYNSDNLPVIPTQNTLCAIYIIRNPLDIAGSLANHKDDTLDDSIDFMNNKQSVFGKQEDEVNTSLQFRQPLLDWSGHVNSWTAKLPFPVMVIRYEDMLADAFETFKQALLFMGIKTDKQQLETAIAASSFEQLKQKETDYGFKERIRNTSFFRSGKAGNWKNELTSQQVSAITSQHQNTMAKYGYI